MVARMAIQPKTGVTKAHVNLMTDTIIASLPPEGLRSVMRSILTTDPGFTSALELHTRRYLQKSASAPVRELFIEDDESNWQVTASFHLTQQRIRAMLGSGLCFQSLRLLREVMNQSANIQLDQNASHAQQLLSHLTAVDGDIVQAITAVEKTLHVGHGTRELGHDEEEPLRGLLQSMLACRSKWFNQQQDFPFERSLASVAGILAEALDTSDDLHSDNSLTPSLHTDLPSHVETFKLAGRILPRLFSGLWQLSSPSWGVASKAQIFQQFSKHVAKGFIAYDMADHYGDAEVLFGKFRASCSRPEFIFGATKLCIFQPTTITKALLHDNITERCHRMSSTTIDLLQLHWQFYDDPQYIEALRLLQNDERVRLLGLCNFDTARMQEILEAGIDIVTNQVQFSLIDSRPTMKMGKVCEEHRVKLLTYGTLCGGFIADKWLGKAEPELFSTSITPSQRKYFEMILAWGGWTLFQELLQMLKDIADKHNVAISNVATRWVLDFPYVGAVIVGARMGVSEHLDQNLDSYGWHLDADDQAAVNRVLSKSRRLEMFEVMGDCGGEYR
ncbi:NADP-dependent oxidoreductase domain-containing protein [Exophiala viscosa]|uniref:NADP-dependent oxidoreductase domain-containing protein n=1 Tax=Exophiala viscosa TaxID=2486360 RepID=A0AAN6E2C8_9EURO|nr:NADP-dependent oxidoreductase domain-containing protein [Exophiala viscosa]KAI1621841.1 NADP-dependent oxidoreductase domain-containing protein [Exophiala viscosa]